VSPVKSVLVSLALIFAGATSLSAQVDALTWEDPTLADAVRDADLIVLAEAKAVATNGVAYVVKRTLKGPTKDGKTIAVRGLHHPELRKRPAVDQGDVSYLILRGKPSGDGFSLPTPTFGRFPLQIGPEGLPQVVASFGGVETYVRLALTSKTFERLLIVLEGKSPTVASARTALGGEARAALKTPSGGLERAYVALRLLALTAPKTERDLVPAALRILSLKAARKKGMYQVRAAAARLLGHMGGKVAAKRLLSLARDDEHAGVRSVAASQLARVFKTRRGTRAYRHAVSSLADLATQARARPITFASVEDPRTNRLEGPLGACLRALAQLRSKTGIRPALRALERDDLDAIQAGLTYFETLKDPEQVGAIAMRMRPKDSKDKFVNKFFARVLETLTGQKHGPSRAAWLRWWDKATLTPEDGREGPRKKAPPRKDKR
jgi:HEAT repeat protein